MRVSSDSRCEPTAVLGAGVEFTALLRYLSTHAEPCWYAGFEDLLTLDALRNPPHRVVLLQSRASQFAQAHFDVAQRVIPETKWLAVIGSYAEGETRSGEPLVGIERVHWTAAVDRFARLCELHDEPSDLSSVQPRSLGGNPGQIVALNQGPRPFPYRLGVVAASNRLAGPVIDACVAAGFCGEQLSPDRLASKPSPELAARLSLCIWVNECARGRRPMPLQAVAASLAPCPILVLSNFVRWQDREAFLRRGAIEVLARPFLLEDLVGQIGRLARPSTLPARPGRQRHAS